MDERDPVRYEAHIRADMKPEYLSDETRRALMLLKRALANEPWMRHAQVTFDDVAVLDSPPRVHVIKRMPHTELQGQANRVRYNDITAEVNWTKIYVE